MSADTEQRKLAAIMFTDMVGYSALSQRDDKLAQELLEEHRQLLREIFPRFNGTEIKTIGDAFLIEFNSALEAAQCAIEIQRTLAKRNHDVTADRRIELKIGIHIGDVVHRGGDVYGDGVNIASRIEPLAGAGGICVSMDVERQIRNALEARFEKLAPTELKNISVAMDLFRIVLPWEQRAKAEPAETSVSGRSFFASRWVWVGAIVLLVVAAGLFVFQFLRPKPTVTPRQIEAVAGVPTKSIAVLPFENLSRDPDNAYFADGIQEEILTRLSKIADLKVISRTSTQRYKSQPDNLPEIAKQLGVANILEGTVQKAADQVRVNVQLISAQNDSHLWADKFDRKLTDIFAVETEIASKIADILQAQLTGSARKAIAARPTENSEAHDLYLRGRYFLGKRGAQNFKKAIDYFDQAIAKDPNYALAYAGLSDCYDLLPQWNAGSRAEYVPKAKAAAIKAVEIDDSLAEAHTSLGAALYSSDLNLGASKREFERAIELDPNYAFAHYSFGFTVLLALGEFDRAIAEQRRAVELDPFSVVINANLGYGYTIARRYPEAITQIQKTLELDPNFAHTYRCLGQALELSGQLDQAIVAYEKGCNIGNDDRLVMMLAHAYALKGDREKALERLNQAKQLEEQSGVWAYGVALVYLGLGDKNEAINWLEQAYTNKEAARIGQIKVDPLLDPLHGDPRFEALAERIVPARFREKNSASSEFPAKSIAVLPFVNMSADKNDEYLSDGMTEELINVLAKVPGLRVPGRTSCFAFKGKNEEDIFRKVGDQLHVGTVLEGSVRKAGDKLRVTAQLINVSDGYHLWSKDYDGDVKDVLNFQSNVAEQVVQALQVHLGAEAARVLSKKPTENSEAHRLYLLGRYEFAKYTQTGWNNAIRYYEQALRIDPEFALAYCGLADNYAYMGSVVMPEKEAIAKEKEFAQKALELDPELAEAHMSFALTLVADYDWRNGLKEFDRALELNPNLAFAYELQAWTVNGLGRFDEAIAKTRKAVELDPLNPFFQMSLSFYQYWARQYDDAIAQARKTLAMDPNSAISHVLLGLSFLKKGDTAGAIAELQKSKAPDPGAWYQGFLGYAYAISGDRAKAEEALRELEQLAKRQYVSPTAFATIYLGLGQKEKCLDWLEKSYEQQDSACWYIKIDQIYDSVRNEPRFQALVKKIFGETQ